VSGKQIFAKAAIASRHTPYLVC